MEENKPIPPKGKYAQLLASFKIGEQRVFEKQKGNYVRQAISKLGVSDQFTTWCVYDGDIVTSSMVVHRFA